MEARISLVTLGVRNLDRAVRFYRDVLQWPTSYASGDSIAFFQLQGMVLGLFAHRALAEDATVDPRRRGFRGVTLAHNVRSRRAVDRIFARLRARQATIIKAPRATDWGGYSGYFADPDGHLWEIAHNPGWRLDPDGNVILP